ncbi:uncharacterized protein VTP21DRAFT_7598 [Calcarisporiella thermophila]|uniref:uncharacterized protein n=1 Tax=Calcarisporiella thermophila TaxID=911321 RepID=UPI003742BB1F
MHGTALVPPMFNDATSPSFDFYNVNCIQSSPQLLISPKGDPYPRLPYPRSPYRKSGHHLSSTQVHTQLTQPFRDAPSSPSLSSKSEASSYSGEFAVPEGVVQDEEKAIRGRDGWGDFWSYYVSLPPQAQMPPLRQRPWEERRELVHKGRPYGYSKCAFSNANLSLELPSSPVPKLPPKPPLPPKLGHLAPIREHLIQPPQRIAQPPLTSEPSPFLDAYQLIYQLRSESSTPTALYSSPFLPRSVSQSSVRQLPFLSSFRPAIALKMYLKSRIESWGCALFVGGFVCPPLWWIGSIYTGKTQHPGWRKCNRVASMVSMVLALVIAVVIAVMHPDWMFRLFGPRDIAPGKS